ncbi:MAG: prolipoprotein diacylglyceryl transferase [Blautia sp.]
MSVRFPNLGLEFEYVPVSVRVFGFEITFFGILLAIGMLLGMAFVVLEAKRKKQDVNLYLGMMISGLAGGFIGARFFYVLLSWSVYKTDIMKVFDTRSGGMVFYGGLLGGVLASAVFCHMKKAAFMEMADIAVKGLLIGQIIGRWGNFFNRESFGEYTSNALTMQLPLSNVRAGEVTPWMRENLVTIDNVSYIQATPLFLYESIWCLLLLLLLFVWNRRKLFAGEIFMRYLAGYGFGRFFIEWIRTDKMFLPGTDIAINQAISAGLFLVFTVVVIIKRIMAKKRAALEKRRKARFYEEAQKVRSEKLSVDELLPEEVTLMEKEKNNAEETASESEESKEKASESKISKDGDFKEEVSEDKIPADSDRNTEEMQEENPEEKTEKE